jgi:UDP-N-acetylmuramate--alanine ligase
MTHTHFIGIGGTGLSAIAKVLLERGETVSGSDMRSSELTSQLSDAGAKIYIGHQAKNIIEADQVVYSSAVSDDNVEYKAAAKSGIPLLNRKEFFPGFFLSNQVIGIAGSHGKTSTTSMTAWMLTALGLNPGFIIGSTSIDLGTNASTGESRLFVIEADEYDHMFWGLECHIAVITNIEHDHPDCFPTPESYLQAFKGFVDRMRESGTLIICTDGAETMKVAKYARNKGLNVISYSLNSSKADFYADDISSVQGSGYSYSLNKGKNKLTDVSLSVPGKHNILNSIASLIIADQFFQDLNEASQKISEYQGSQRRFQIKAEINDILIVDDYGHHPTEIKTTLEGAKATYPNRRIVAVWEPHTYSRTLKLIREFAAAFDDADQAIITEIYPARETKPEGFDPYLLLKAFTHPNVQIQDSINGTIDYLGNCLLSGDLLIVFSAGLGLEITDAVLDNLQKREVEND